MTAAAKLLPCPFCGEPGEFAGCEQDGHYVRCSGRGCYGEVGENYDGCAMPSHMFSSQEDAAAAWNRRASPAELGGVPVAVAIQPNSLVLRGGIAAIGDYAIEKTPGCTRIVNAEFARGWNEARAAMLSTPRAAEAVTLAEIRTAVADYMRSEGCSCCRDSEAHEVNAARLARLLSVEPYDDGSGYDFSPYRSSALTPPSAKGE